MHLDIHGFDLEGKKDFQFENNFEGLVIDKSYCQDDLRNLTFFVLQSCFGGEF